MRRIIIAAKKTSGRFLRAFGAIGLSIVLVLSCAGCGISVNIPSEAPSSASESVGSLRPNSGSNELDTRASASQTFGGAALVSVQAGSEQVDAEDVLALTPGDTIMSFTEFMAAFIQNKAAFQEHLMSALTQAGLQTSVDNEVIRLDTLDLADLFVAFAAWEDGPEAVLDLWQTLVGEGVWTLDQEEGKDYIHLLFSRDAVPTAEFYGCWYEADQYFFGILYTSDYALEIDIVRTDYGFACQLFEPGTPAVYRFSFTDDGSWDGGIGYTFSISSQPDVLTGQETLAYAMEWAEAGPMQTTHILIEGTTLTVAEAGGAVEYTIDTGAAVTTEPGVTTNLDNYTDSALSAEAAPYARLWHGSPVLGSGWSERFALYEDGSFIWGANEMDGASRLRYLAGTWDVKDGELILTSKLIIGWEGGEVVPNTGTGSYGSDEVIENPTVVICQTEEALVLPLSKITHDSERDLDTATFNELQCWDYSGQEEGAMDDFWISFMNSWNRAPVPKDKSMPASGVK